MLNTETGDEDGWGGRLICRRTVRVLDTETGDEDGWGERLICRRTVRVLDTDNTGSADGRLTTRAKVRGGYHEVKGLMNSIKRLMYLVSLREWTCHRDLQYGCH